MTVATTMKTTTSVVGSGGDDNKGGSNNSNSRGNLTFILKAGFMLQLNIATITKHIVEFTEFTRGFKFKEIIII